MEIGKRLLNIQQELKAPKKQYNSYGNYNYRTTEDILEAVKPLLKANNCILTIEDELVNIGARYYIKAVATVATVENTRDCYSNVGYAREPESKKGMDESQITGACSSYARKYALNGLFCIDDVKDADTTNISGNTAKTAKKVNSKQIALINQLVQDKAGMLKYYHVKRVEDLTEAQADGLIKAKQKQNKPKPLGIIGITAEGNETLIKLCYGMDTATKAMAELTAEEKKGFKEIVIKETDDQLTKE